MNQTEHSKYNLPSELDEVKTLDYNENFEKIDTEIFELDKAAKDAKETAEKAMEQVEAAGGQIATTERLGVVKPDGDTILIDEDGTLHGSQEFKADGYIYVNGESAGDPTDPPTLNADTFGGETPDKFVKKSELGIGNEMFEVELPLDGWSAAYPYSQTISVTGVDGSSDYVVIGPVYDSSATQDQVRNIKKAFSCLMVSNDGISDGSITFKAVDKPEVTFKVAVYGKIGS